MRFAAILLVSIECLVGCASTVKRTGIDPEKSAMLFPNGNYVHQVRLNIPSNPDPSKRTFEFRGAVKIATETIRIAVLSPVGTTLFKLSEERATGKVTVENSIPQLKPYDSRLADYYASLRILLTTARHPTGTGYRLDDRGRPASLETAVDGRPTRFVFAAYDEHQIPTELRVESSTFQVDVEVTGYEL